MDDALKAAKDAIKAGGSAKYNGKIHTSLASLLGVDEESEDSGQADVAALNSDLEEARFRLKESQESREYWYNAHKEQAEELDFVRTELERTKLSLDDSNDALKAKTDENKVKDKEITDLKAQIEKLKTEVTEAKKPKAETAKTETPAANTHSAPPPASTPAPATPATPASTRNA